MKITESEFRAIIKKKLDLRFGILSEQASGKPTDLEDIRTFRIYANTGGRKAELERMYTAAQLEDKTLDTEGDNLSNNNRHFNIAWEMYGSDNWQGNPEPEPSPAPRS